MFARCRRTLSRRCGCRKRSRRCSPLPLRERVGVRGVTPFDRGVSPLTPALSHKGRGGSSSWLEETPAAAQPQSRSRTPPTTSGRCGRTRRWSKMRGPWSTPPPFGSYAPNTTRPTRKCTAAAAHIGHGSSVTTSVHPISRGEPTRRAAARIASSSACADASWSRSTRLPAAASTAPPGPITTAPTGTSAAAAAVRPPPTPDPSHLLARHPPAGLLTPA